MTIFDQPEFTAYSKTPILFLVDEPAATAVKAIADVFIWFGDKNTDKPVNENYRLSKVLDANNKAIFNVGDFVKDFLTNEDPNTYDGAMFEPNVNEACWLEISFGYIDEDGVVVPDEIKSNIILCSRGYSNFLQGKNPQLPVLLTSVSRQIVDEGNTCILGISNAENVDLNKVVFTPDVGAPVTFNPTLNKNLSSEALVYFDCSPVVFTGQFKESYNISVQDESNNILGEIDFTVKEKCKYALYTLQYVNKYGVWDFIPYNMRSVLSSEVEKEQYQNTDLGISQSTTTLSYDASKPQFRNYNINTMRSIELNTDLLDPSIDEGIEEMLSSDYCYLNEAQSPVNPVERSFNRQQYVNRDLIQYTTNFKFAYIEQNKIV